MGKTEAKTLRKNVRTEKVGSRRRRGANSSTLSRESCGVALFRGSRPSQVLGNCKGESRRWPSLCRFFRLSATQSIARRLMFPLFHATPRRSLRRIKDGRKPAANTATYGVTADPCNGGMRTVIAQWKGYGPNSRMRSGTDADATRMSKDSPRFSRHSSRRINSVSSDIWEKKTALREV